MRILSTGRRTAWFVAVVAAWAVWSTFLYMVWGAGADDCWFLLVARRMLRGEVLYRDIFFGVPPLSAYLMAMVAALGGVEMVLLRALNCVVAAIILCLVAWQARRAGVSDRTIVLMSLAFPVLADPRPDSLYPMLAVLFFVAAGVPSHPALAGMFAGLAFATKQTAGVLALAALLGAWACERQQFRRRALPACAAFLAASALFLIPVAISGGWSDFIRYGFLNKTVFLRTGKNYFAASELNPAPWVAAGGWFLGIGRWMSTWRFVLPLALLPLAWRLRQKPDPLRIQAFAFALCSLGLFYPRADAFHVRHAAPSLLLAAALVPKRPPRAWVTAALAGLLFWSLAVWYATPVWHVLRGKLAFSGLPHYRGVLWSRESMAQWLPQLPQVRGAAEKHGPILLLTPFASFLHLAGDIPSATPFDYPLVSVFGPRGQAAMIADLKTGRLAGVCLKDDFAPELRPTELVKFVRSELAPGADLGACRLYFPRPPG